jgi:hypothetical protein
MNGYSTMQCVLVNIHQQLFSNIDIIWKKETNAYFPDAIGNISIDATGK